MFTLIDLPYKSLVPVISDETLSFHHGKHLQTYVDNLNKLIVGSEFEQLCHSERSEESVLEEIVKHSSGAIFNNAGQVLNHNMYFSQFAPTPHPGLDPGSPLGKQIVKQWGSVDSFKAEFEAKGVSLFGSGWVWLQAAPSGELSIAQYSNADNPVAHGLRPLLTFDVWEHAYYLDYQNKRAAHLSALWGIVDWNAIIIRF
jgi:Fe-Mn family superoxide dismutase